MELGARWCARPKRPDAKRCPLRGECLAYAHGSQNELPVRKAKPAVPHYTVTAAVIRREGLVLIAQRPQGGLLGGLWEFPGGKLETSDPDLPACLRREIREELGVEVCVGQSLGVFRHAYTHFRITLHAFACSLPPGEDIPVSEAVRWVPPSELAGFPMGKVDRLRAACKPGRPESLFPCLIRGPVSLKTGCLRALDFLSMPALKYESLRALP